MFILTILILRKSLRLDDAVLANTIAGVMLLLSGSGQAVTADWEKLFSGEIIVKAVDSSDRLPGVRASFVVDAQPEAIWAALIDYENFTDIFKEMDKVNVLKQYRDGAKVEFWLSLFWKQYHYVLYRHYDSPGRKLTWQRVSGDLERIEGSWEIQQSPHAGKQLVIYESYVDPGGMIPPAFVRWRSMGKARDMAKRLREWIVDHPLHSDNTVGSI